MFLCGSRCCEVCLGREDAEGLDVTASITSFEFLVLNIDVVLKKGGESSMLGEDDVEVMES